MPELMAPRVVGPKREGKYVNPGLGPLSFTRIEVQIDSDCRIVDPCQVY